MRAEFDQWCKRRQCDWLRISDAKGAHEREYNFSDLTQGYRDKIEFNSCRPRAPKASDISTGSHDNALYASKTAV